MDDSFTTSSGYSSEENDTTNSEWEKLDMYAVELFVKFDNICQEIGSGKFWPERILRLFWSRMLSDSELLTLCVFAWVNHLPKKTLLDFLRSNDAIKSHQMIINVEHWFQQFENEAKSVQRLFSFNVLNNRFDYVDGEVKLQLRPNQDIPCY
jgi:hypothetical protein